MDAAPVNLKPPAGPPDPAKFEEFISKFTLVSQENFNLKTELDQL